MIRRWPVTIPGSGVHEGPATALTALTALTDHPGFPAVLRAVLLVFGVVGDDVPVLVDGSVDDG